MLSTFKLSAFDFASRGHLEEKEEIHSAKIKIRSGANARKGGDSFLDLLRPLLQQPASSV